MPSSPNEAVELVELHVHRSEVQEQLRAMRQQIRLLTEHMQQLQEQHSEALVILNDVYGNQRSIHDRLTLLGA